MCKSSVQPLKDSYEIRVFGEIDAEIAGQILSHMLGTNIYVVNFEEVSSINFAAMRVLLNGRRGEDKRFRIINASNDIVARFEDSGLSSIISICRKPCRLDVDKYQEFGASFMSRAYNSADGDTMIKIYGDFASKHLICQEQAVARAVLAFGINTPMVGSLYTDGKSQALEFERIEGKRSFSKIISEEPERLEEITVRFARMCRQLHETPCDTNIFNDKSLIYRQAINNCKEITDNEKDKILSFIDSVPSRTTCLHGDMQLSNVITNGREDMWIDLADFSYGNPMFDLGMTYFLCKLNSEEQLIKLFHFGRETMDRVWDIFIREYFNVTTAEQIELATRSLEPFAALHMLYLGTTFFFMPFMLPYIRKVLLSD